MMDILLLFAGLTATYFGAYWLVKGSARLAISWNTRPVVVGFLVGAFGTAIPKFIVSFIASLKGMPDIALGNAVGSNILNIGLIFGLSAITYPLVIHKKLFRFEKPFMVFTAVALFIASIDGVISRIDGILFAAIFIEYIVYTIKVSKVKEAGQMVKEGHKEFLQNNNSSAVKDLILIAAGLAVLIAGAGILVKAALLIARTLGLNELIAGMTIVAVGTSLPELATSVIALFKTEALISIGNVAGSSIFNILFILGITGAIQPVAVNPEALKLHMPVMIFISLIPLIFIRRGSVINRLTGAALVLFYAGYCGYIMVF